MGEPCDDEGISMSEWIADHFKVNVKPIATQEAVFRGNTYRISFLTSRIVRLEYDVNGIFEDKATQTFWYREQVAPELVMTETDDVLKIESEHLRLVYLKDEPFKGDTLSIELKHSCLVWRFGTEEETNLKGTARTLDAVDGELVLEKGLISREGYVVIDDSTSLVFNEHSWLEPRQTTGIDTYFFGYGQAYKACLSDYVKLTGAAPLLPRYALGNWWSRYWRYSDVELEQLMTRFEQEEIPLSVCIIDMDWHVTDIDPKYGSGWTGYTWNRELFKDPKGFMSWLHEKGLKTSLNLHPALGIRANEACYEEVATFMDVDVKAEQPVLFDIADPKFMKAYFEKVHHPLEEEGVDFWWIDWQQGTNSSMKGLDPLYALNHLHYLDLGRHEQKRPFTFSRWPGLGGHRYPIGFSGDTIVTWESLQYQPYFTATAANVLYGWWSHDIGGHMLGLDDSELYARWVQFGVFSPINRLHTSCGVFNRREPWKHSYESFQTAKKFLQLRHELIPYIYTMSHRHEKTGLALVTPLYYDYPHHGSAYDFKDEYLFGSELLVAPYLTPRSQVTNRSTRQVWLPEGEWFDFFTGEPYTGDRIYAVYGQLDEMPVFAKAGAIIPMAKLEESNQVKNPNHLEVLVFGKAMNEFKLYEDDGESRKYETGQQAYTTFNVSSTQTQLTFTINKVEGDLTVIPTNRSYTLKFRGICEMATVSVEAEGVTTMTQTSYDKETATLELTVVNHSPLESVVITLSHEMLFNYTMDVTKRLIELVQYATVQMPQKQRYEGFMLNPKEQLADKIMYITAQPIQDELKQATIALLSKALMIQSLNR